jgi:hypothetical protein
MYSRIVPIIPFSARVVGSGHIWSTADDPEKSTYEYDWVASILDSMRITF